MLKQQTQLHTSDEHIFYNVSLINPVDSHTPLPAVFNETRTTPILDNCSNYTMSVIRFSIPSTLVPLIQIRPLGYPASSDVNKTIFSVSLGYNGSVTAQQYLEWIPQTSTAPSVKSFTALQPGPQVNDPYYFDFSYQNFVDMINVALKAAYAAGLSFLPGSMTAAPYMIYDPSTEIFSLIGQQAMSHSSDPTDVLNVVIYFNTPLYAHFPGFQTYIRGFNLSNGRDNQILIKNNLNNSPSTQTGMNPNIPSGYYEIQSEFHDDDALETLNRIVFVSNSIPVRAEAESGSGGGEMLSIIKDFIAQVSTTNGQYRTAFQYYVQSEFIKTDMVSSNALVSIQLSIYWSDTVGNLYPILLNPGDNLSIKFLFERKK